MRDSAAARRYGKALFEVAVESGEEALRLDEITRFRLAVSRSPLFLHVMSDMRIRLTKRLMIASEVTREMKLTRELANLVALITKRSRSELILQILDDASRRLRKKLNIVKVKTTVADENDVAIVKKNVEKMLGDVIKAKIDCDVFVDRSIIGGFKLQIENRVFDGSIRAKLAKLAGELSRNTITR